MLDKNPDPIRKIFTTLYDMSLNSIVFDDAITKTYFFHKLATISEAPVIYFDFDMLYSGYLAANILRLPQNLVIYQPKEDSWKKLLIEVLDLVSRKQHLIIIDSLNGFHTMMPQQNESGRIINNFVMMLASMAQKSESVVLVGSISKFKKESGWVLSGFGRRVIDVEKMNRFWVRAQNSKIQLLLVDQQNAPKNTIDLTPMDL